MARSERLLALLQALRRRRRPISGRVLADELGVSLRTLYRDIASLQGQGAEIEGEAGLGYVLKPGFWLPPLMLSGEEIEALVLGARWVGARTDESLALAAHDAIAKISAVLPPSLREDVEASTLIVPPSEGPGAATLDLAPIRADLERFLAAGRTVILLAVDGAAAAAVAVADPIKPSAARAIAELKRLGIETAPLKAPFDRGERKAGVVLAPRQPLFLDRRNR